MQSLQNSVKEKLLSRIPDAKVTVIDFSDEHVGHHASGAHIAVTVTSKIFEGKSLVEQHQLIYKILDEEIKNQTIHALRIRTRIKNNE